MSSTFAISFTTSATSITLTFFHAFVTGLTFAVLLAFRTFVIFTITINLTSRADPGAVSFAVTWIIKESEGQFSIGATKGICKIYLS